MGDNPKVNTGVNKVSNPGKWISDMGAKELKKMSKVPILTNGTKVFEWITNPLELHHGCCPDLCKESADTGEMRALRIVDHQPTWIKVNGFEDDGEQKPKTGIGKILKKPKAMSPAQAKQEVKIDLNVAGCEVVHFIPFDY